MPPPNPFFNFLNSLPLILYPNMTFDAANDSADLWNNDNNEAINSMSEIDQSSDFLKASEDVAASAGSLEDQLKALDLRDFFGMIHNVLSIKEAELRLVKALDAGEINLSEFHKFRKISGVPDKPSSTVSLSQAPAAVVPIAIAPEAALKTTRAPRCPKLPPVEMPSFIGVGSSPEQRFAFMELTIEYLADQIENDVPFTLSTLFLSICESTKNNRPSSPSWKAGNKAVNSYYTAFCRAFNKAKAEHKIVNRVDAEGKVNRSRFYFAKADMSAY